LKRRCYRRFSKAKYSPINRRGRDATIRDLGNDTRDNNSSHTRSRNEGCRKWRSWQGNAVAYDASLHEKRFPLEPAPAPQALRAGYPKERSLRFCKPARSCYPCFRCKRRPKLSSKEKPRRLDEYRTADLEAIKDQIRSACHRNRPTGADVHGEAAISLFSGFSTGNVARTLVALPPVLGALPPRVTLRLGERWQRKGGQ
jgi:hypothetical protein